jgi:hypothetical protein
MILAMSHDSTQGGPIPVHRDNGDLRSDRHHLRLDRMTKERALRANIAKAMLYIFAY